MRMFGNGQERLARALFSEHAARSYFDQGARLPLLGSASVC